MSHKATNWAINQRGLKPATKLVLWYLCDRHHPDHGCFPSQETLAEDCEMSRSSLNTHLKELEARGLIQRIQRSDKTSKRQQSTLYLLAFEDQPEAGKSRRRRGPGAKSGHGTSARAPGAKSGHGAGTQTQSAPCPETGDGRTSAARRAPCATSGQGAVSKKQGEPCPEMGRSRVQNVDTILVKEPVKNQRARGEGLPNPLVVADAKRAVERFRQGRDDALAEVKPWVRNHILAANLLTPDERRRSGMI